MLIETLDQIAILHWDGEITLNVTDKFRESLQILSSSKCNYLLLNLESVTYLNSVALGAIATLTITEKQNGRELAVCSIQPSLRKIFEIVKFETFMKLFDTQEEGVTYFLELDQKMEDKEKELN